MGDFNRPAKTDYKTSMTSTRRLETRESVCVVPLSCTMMLRAQTHRPEIQLEIQHLIVGAEKCCAPDAPRCGRVPVPDKAKLP